VSTFPGYTGLMSFGIERDTDRTGKTTYLLLSGVFDRVAQRDLRRSLRDAFARSRHGRVVLDVARVDELSGECVETLLTAYTLALRGGHGFEVTNARGHVRLLLEATGLCAPALYAPAWLTESTAHVA
jgi:anti-anti-sigma regulatory factor